jgi:hypothetical protein
MFFLNPFKKHDASEFPNTHIDLADANSIVDARHPPLNQQANAEKDGADSGKDSDAHSGSASIRAGSTRGLTVAELREMVDQDVGANDSQSIYDSESRGRGRRLSSMLTFNAEKSKVINRAIADMGMGRYQWQLFVLCGFGWMADK